MKRNVADAQKLLLETATELMRLPLDEVSRPMHVKLLELRRAIAVLPDEPESSTHLERELHELRRLHAEVRRLRAAAPDAKPPGAKNRRKMDRS
jgi:hypothetical protein